MYSQCLSRISAQHFGQYAARLVFLSSRGPKCLTSVCLPLCSRSGDADLVRFQHLSMMLLSVSTFAVKPNDIAFSISVFGQLNITVVIVFFLFIYSYFYWSLVAGWFSFCLFQAGRGGLEGRSHTFRSCGSSLIEHWLKPAPSCAPVPDDCLSLVCNLCLL